ncbi:MAG: hypothetical protein NTX06_13000 [Proteobacteria bacterium]|nr:hypothetical protein [Pseudomonadota bacterium]
MGFALELDTLPKKARSELVDYYEFLLKKYSGKPSPRAKKTVAKFEAFIGAPISIIHFMMPDREVRYAR